MRFRDRQNPELPAPQNTGGPSPHLNRLRDAADELLAAGDNAINRALSGQSQAFLKANRQQSGE